MDDPAIVELYWQRSDRAIPETAAKYGNYCRSIACNILQNPQDAEERGFDPPESDLLSDFLLLFEPEAQYLIHLGGSHSDYSFEILEKIADNMELKVTDFPTKPLNERQSYIILDLGRG